MKFIVTNELGRLARWLRILGYDTAYDNANDTSKLVITSLRERRVILTRDRRMSRFTGIRMFRIKDDGVEEQLRHVIRGLELRPSEKQLFQRCVDCNEILIDVAKDAVRELVPAYVFEVNDAFKQCPVCTKIFWKGTHWRLAKNFLKNSECDLDT